MEFFVREMLLVAGGHKAHDVPYRFAKRGEIERAMRAEGAPHVTFGCGACGAAAWSAKNIALGPNGGYTGARNIFYFGHGPECACPASALRMIVEDVNAPARLSRD